MPALIAGFPVSIAAQPQIKTWMAGTKPGHDLSAFAARMLRTPKFAPNQSIGGANQCGRCVNLRRMELFAFADIP